MGMFASHQFIQHMRCLGHRTARSLVPRSHQTLIDGSMTACRGPSLMHTTVLNDRLCSARQMGLTFLSEGGETEIMNASPNSQTHERSGSGRDDVIIVGAGFAGMYMLHRLREAGFRVRCFEAGSGPGGTWYWNRYPGARCDIHSLAYSYSFSKELEQDWGFCHPSRQTRLAR
jgi:hypothetical protein